MRTPKPALGLLCLGLGAVILFEIGTGFSDEEAESGHSSAMTGGPVAGADDTALAAAILERPLFTPNRHPSGSAPPLPPMETAPASSGWEWRLAGILVTPSRREALFVQAGRKQPVAEGEAIDGWKLVSIRPGGVTLTNGNAEKNLSPEPEPASAGEAVQPPPLPGFAVPPALLGPKLMKSGKPEPQRSRNR